MSDFGSSLFKVQSGTASFADVLSVLRLLEESPSIRERCSALSGLVSDMPEPERAGNCEAIASIFFAHSTIPEKSETPPRHAYLATARFTRECCPPPKSRWVTHVQAHYDRKGNPTRAVISDDVGQVLHAIENLWGVPGHLVRKL